MNCEYAKNDSTEGRAPMYGHSAEQTALSRASTRYSSITSASVAVRYFINVGNRAAACSNIAGSWMRIGACAVSRNILRRRSKNARMPAASFGNWRMCASRNGSSPTGANTRSPGNSTSYRWSIWISSHSSPTSR